MINEIINLKTLIRADSSFDIGHGHIRRDLVFACKFKDISFACLELQGSIINEIKYPVFKLKNGSLDELINLIKEHKFELLVLDHYGLDYKFERAIKEATGIKILSFDDEIKEHFCDILLNVNVYAKEQMYKNLLPNFTKICCGREFMLVRDEFYKERDIKRDKKFDFFVGLGGSDILGIGFDIARILVDKNYKVSMATTTANPMLDKLINFSEIYKNFSLFINSNEIARLMNESRELIIQASSFVNEALVLGSKFKAIRTASNQNYICDWLRQNSFKVYDGDEICNELSL